SDPDLPFKGKDCCWCCGKKHHSYRYCYKWLAKHGQTNDQDHSGSTSGPGRWSPAPIRKGARSGKLNNNSSGDSDSEESDGKATMASVVTTKNKYAALDADDYGGDLEDEMPSA